jgi:hypothetical protein
MDLSKFIWMVQQQALYFCRVDALNDPYEGYYTQAMINVDGIVASFHGAKNAVSEMEKNESTVQMIESIKTVSPGLKQLMSSLGFERAIELMEGIGKTYSMVKDGKVSEEWIRGTYKQSVSSIKGRREQFYLSCWHMNEEESLAMWKQYTPHGHSVCVRSTYEVLANHLPSECFLGRIRYINYRTQFMEDAEGLLPSPLSPVFHKRRMFEHEREVRAVIWREDPTNDPPFAAADDGKALIVPVSLAEIIQEVFVSPEAKPPMREVVEGLLRAYNLTAPVRQSLVNEPPGF